MEKEIIIDEATGDKWTPDGQRIISIKVPKDVVDRLDAYASEHGMTRSEVISLAINEETDKMGMSISPEELAEAEEREKARFNAALVAKRKRDAEAATGKGGNQTAEAEGQLET